MKPKHTLGKTHGVAKETKPASDHHHGNMLHSNAKSSH